jgi:ubiquinone/menaquinone biosynthesis C-methylase UbiE
MEETIEKSGEIVWENIFNAVKFAKHEMVYENMMEYYDERAKEYDEIYEGKGPASLAPKYYEIDIKNLETFIKGFGSGNAIDIACGSGYWLQYFYKRCNAFTFFDQSQQMLEECKHKAGQFEIMDRAKFIKGDILEYKFDDEEKFDCAIIGFLIGHFTKVQDEIFFNTLRKILKKGSEFLIIDNTWTRKRAEKQNKEDIAERRLNDGRSYKIYKKYFGEEDLPNLLRSYDFIVKDSFFGNTFAAVIGVV